MSKNSACVSISIIEKKCQQNFSRHFTTMVYGKDFVWPKKSVPNLLLLGGSPNILLNETIWPAHQCFRLYVVSQAHRRVLIQLLGFKKNEVGLISRGQLFPLPRKARDYDPQSKNLHLVYSGRLDQPEKNLELTLRVMHGIQKRRIQKTEITFCGPQWSIRSVRNLKKRIDSLKWKQKPRLRFDLGPQWPKKISGEPVLIHLSTYNQEDFGVSVAEAQQQGWPVIISDWGGHQDVKQGTYLKIPVSLIQKKKAKDIVEKCFRSRRSLAEQKSLVLTPKIISTSEMQKKYRGIPPRLEKRVFEFFAVESGKINVFKRDFTEVRHIFLG